MPHFCSAYGFLWLNFGEDHPIFVWSYNAYNALYGTVPTFSAREHPTDM